MIDFKKRRNYIIRYHSAMKYANFLLILLLVFCYTGSIARAYYTPDLSSTENCHTNKQKDTSDTNAAGYYKSIEATEHETLKCCHDALPTPPYIHDSHITAYVLEVKAPTSDINKRSNFFLDIETKKEYRPPDLFLINSSFLI